jgi:hypothetical protein
VCGTVDGVDGVGGFVVVAWCEELGYGLGGTLWDGEGWLVVCEFRVDVFVVDVAAAGVDAAAGAAYVGLGGGELDGLRAWLTPV